MSICKNISTLLELYAEGKLGERERKLVEEHLAVCPECRDKYVRMKAAIKNLRSSYELLLKEFEEIEKHNKAKEHNIFYLNISSYIDNELPYSEAVDFRRYILKSKPARKSLEEAYSLRNTLKTSFNEYSDKLKLNYAKEIIKQLRSERKEPTNMILKRMMITLGVLLVFMIAFFLYVTSAYNKQVSENIPTQNQEIVQDTESETWEEEPAETQITENEESETLAEVSEE